MKQVTKMYVNMKTVDLEFLVL